MVPLSDHEERILAEIEKNLLAEDPDLERRSAASRRRRGASGARLGIGLFVAGLLALLLFFYTSMVLIGVVAFAAMVAGIVTIVGAVRASVKTRSTTVDGPREQIIRAFARWETTWRERMESRRHKE